MQSQLQQQMYPSEFLETRYLIKPKQTDTESAESRHERLNVTFASLCTPLHCIDLTR